MTIDLLNYLYDQFKFNFAIISSSDRFIFTEIKRLSPANQPFRIMASIDNKNLFENIPTVLDCTDGICINLDVLGRTFDPIKLHGIHKLLVKSCVLSSKPALLYRNASLFQNPVDPRLSVLDLYMSILSTIDCIFLNMDVTTGKPQLIPHIQSICQNAENNVNFVELQNFIVQSAGRTIGISESIASSAVLCSRNLKSLCIAVFTEGGGMVKFVAKYRPEAKIIAISHNKNTLQYLSVFFNINVYLLEMDHSFSNSDKHLRDIVIQACKPPEAEENANFIMAFGQLDGFIDGSSTFMQISQY